MLNDFQAAFRPSKIRQCAIMLLTILFSLCVLVYFSGGQRWILLITTGFSSAWAWREPKRVQQIIIDDAHQAWLLFHHDTELHAAELLSGSLIHRWGCFFKWRCGEHLFWQIILPDMLHADTFRRLRLWAQFAQKL